MPKIPEDYKTFLNIAAMIAIGVILFTVMFGFVPALLSSTSTAEVYLGSVITILILAFLATLVVRYLKKDKP